MSSSRRNTPVMVGAAGLVLAAVVTELRKPAAARTWTGRVLNLVPYDLRTPTWRRVRDTFWDPDNPRLVVPHAYGVGWSVNLARVLGRSGRRA